MATAASAHSGRTHATTTITFWDAYSTGGAEVQHLEKIIIPAFEKSHPGIVVKDLTVPYDDLHTKLVTAVAGAQLPDLVRSDIIWVPELANLGVLAPLDKDMPDFKAYAAKVVSGPARDQLLEGSLLRAAARHEYAHLGLQPGGARRDRRQRAADHVRATGVDVGAGQGEGDVPLRRERNGRLEPVAVDLVERRQPDEQDVHQGNGLSQRSEERRRDPDARRPLQGR